MANVDRSILVVDFLKHYNILVDVKNKKLIDQLTSLSVNTLSINIPLHDITMTQSGKFNEELWKLLEQFTCVVHEALSLNTIKHNVVHFIETSGPPVMTLNTEKLKITKTEIDK